MRADSDELAWALIHLSEKGIMQAFWRDPPGGFVYEFTEAARMMSEEQLQALAGENDDE